MRISMQLVTVFISLVLFGSSCASLEHYSGDTAERINWREHGDC